MTVKSPKSMKAYFYKRLVYIQILMVILMFAFAKNRTTS